MCMIRQEKYVLSYSTSVLVERLLEKTSLLESLVVKLERSNQQFVTLNGEQGQEIQGPPDDITATSKRSSADDERSQAVALLMGNNLLRDERVDQIVP